jgi:hypothetical protein
VRPRQGPEHPPAGPSFQPSTAPCPAVILMPPAPARANFLESAGLPEPFALSRKGSDRATGRGP